MSGSNIASLPVTRRCQARANRTGDQCQRWSVHGLRVCRVHGGAAPQSLAKRERVIAQERIEHRVSRLVAGAALSDETPAEALRRLSYEGLALCVVLREHVSERGDVVDENGQVSHVAQGFLVAIDRVTRMLQGLEDRELASAERAARIDGKDATLLSEHVKAAVYAPQVGLAPEQARAVLQELRRRLLTAP